MGRKTFLSVNSWVGMKESKWWGLGVSSPSLPKSFLLKMEIKLKEEIGHHFWMKMPICNCTWASSTLLFFTLFFFFFFFPPGHCLPPPLLFLFFFYFLWFTGHACPEFFFFFGCCCCYLDVIFLWTWFLFFNKFRWLIFFFWLFITFLVLIGHQFFFFFYGNWKSFFNKGICINLY